MKNSSEGKGEFHAIECDVTKEENIVNTFENIKKNFGSIHVLVNNAGLMVKGSMTGEYIKIKT